MKYTKNIHNKLIQKNFSFDHEHEEIKEENYLHYTVYIKGIIEVIVFDSHKKVEVRINAENHKIDIKSLTQLNKLDQILNSLNT